MAIREVFVCSCPVRVFGSAAEKIPKPDQKRLIKLVVEATAKELPASYRVKAVPGDHDWCEGGTFEKDESLTVIGHFAYRTTDSHKPLVEEAIADVSKLFAASVKELAEAAGASE